MIWRNKIKEAMAQSGDSFREFKAIAYTWPKYKGDKPLRPEVGGAREWPIFQERFTTILNKAQPFLDHKICGEYTCIIWTKNWIYISDQYYNLQHLCLETRIRIISRNPKKGVLCNTK